jgi:hypothetical protein
MKKRKATENIKTNKALAYREHTATFDALNEASGKTDKANNHTNK